LTAALKAASLAAHSAQSVASGYGEQSIRSSSCAVKTRARKRRSRDFPLFSGICKSTISLPIANKIFLLHLRQTGDNLPCQIPLPPQPFPSRTPGSEIGDFDGKAFPFGRQIAIGILAVTPEINAQHPAVRVLLEKTADAVREVFLIHPAAAGTPPLGEDHQRLSVFQYPMALRQGILQFLTVPAPTDGDTFRQIAKRRLP